MSYQNYPVISEGSLDDGISYTDLNSKGLSDHLSVEELQNIIITNRESARKIAHSLLRRWRVTLPLEETESLVDLTLCEAANRFSPEHGASFMTFFFYYVRGNLARNIGKLVRISQVFVTPGTALDSVDFNIKNQSTRTNNLSSSESWESPAPHENNIPENAILKHEMSMLCNRALSKLDPVDREVLLRLYDDDETLVDIAKSLGYSRCHISRIKKRALKQFRSSFALINEDKTAQDIDITTSKASGIRPETKRRGRHRREIPSTLLKKKQTPTLKKVA